MSAASLGLREVHPTCPEFKKARVAIFGATALISTFLHTIAGSLPPSSRVILFRVLLALSITFFPVAVLPVKEILSMPGWAVSQGPKLSSPERAWITPGGKNCWASSANFRSQYGVNGEGLRMIVFPVRIAGPIFPHAGRNSQQVRAVF